jgi:serine/threonine protein kinase
MSTSAWTAAEAPPTLLQCVDQVCDAFEAAWQRVAVGAPRPRVQDYLADAPEAARADLLRELLVLDVAYRRRAGEAPTPEDYDQQFPHQGALIEEVFRRAGGSAPTAEAPTLLRAPVPTAARPVAGASGTPTTVGPVAFAVFGPGAAAVGPSGTPTTVGPAPAARADWPRIPRYEIVDELDTGGMGVVYRARHVRLDRPVALKMIRSGPAAGAGELARFEVEARAVAALDHPSVVRIYDYGRYQGRPYFAMELLAGGSLAQALHGQLLTPAKAAELVETLARAMDFVHARGIIHRDLKPANILLTADGTPKIADFGLAKRLDTEQGPTTVTGAVLGTASYMAPEQAAGRTADVGPAADVYALGAVLYETLAGRPPFRGATRELTMAQVLCDEPVPPSHHQPDTPADLEAICLKCLEKEPAQRYPSAAAFAEDLRRFRDGEPLTVEPLGPVERQTRWARRAGYEIVELTGCSVLGMIFKARQVRLAGRLVTLKIISPEAQTDPANLARFRAEAETAGKLQHPNIVQIYDFGEHAGQAYLSLEHVEGGTLADRCLGQPVAPREAAELLETLARAAHCAHEQGIVHSDLRPFNVCLTTTGVPKVTGFGLARLLSQDAGVAGTPRGFSNYMAPEQLEGRRDRITPATDVHALGAMLYEMLTGRPPFLAATVRETLAQIRTQIPPPPSRLEPAVRKELDDVCLKCLEKDPAARYPSALALADELHRFQAGPPTEEFELIPNYEILEQLGSGGIGVVSRARQISLDRLVALKILRGNLAQSLAANRAVARVNHPNIVQVYDSGERENFLYVAEELVEGGSLRDRIAGRPQPAREAAALVETLARAMHHMHQQGIIHRNLKPSVVLLTGLGVPKIGSFDLARLLNHAAVADKEGRLLSGTPLYMAPEQLAGGEEVIGPATDVYGLGLILYEMLTGRPPFQPDNLIELFAQIRWQPVPPPSRWEHALPAALEAICMRCLHKSPAERYASALALAQELRDFLDGRRPGGGPWRQVVGWLRRLSPAGLLRRS